MKQYLNLIQEVLSKGTKSQTRSGETISIFGHQARYDLTDTFPAVTTKKLYWNGVVTELLWFLRGDTNIKYLHDHNVHIWDEWADEQGNLGPIYGKQWRNMFYAKEEILDKIRDCGTQMSCTLEYPHRLSPALLHKELEEDASTIVELVDSIQPIDQIAWVINSIKTRPESRRHLVTTWNPGELDKMRLEPCHDLFQFHVNQEKGTLSCHLFQRSGDAFLGIPFNIASYSLLTCMIAQVCDLKPGEFVHSISDLHIYTNHLNQVNLQLSREPLPLPKLWLDPSIKNIDDFKHEHIKLVDYTCHPAIKAQVSV